MLQFLMVISLLSILSVISVYGQTETDISCGEVLEAELTPEVIRHFYSIPIAAGTRVTLRVEPIGSTLNPVFALRDPAGNDLIVVNENTAGLPEILTDFEVSSSNPVIEITGYSANELRASSTAGRSLGAYTLFVSCEFRDGTQIIAGQPPSGLGIGAEPPSPIVEDGPFYGFAGLESVSFTDGIELPLQADQAQTSPLANDIVLYTYEASAASTATLSIVRVSGDISVGITVINQSNNNVIFIGGMPSSNNLNVELTFPTSGTYVIGLFRLDTAERSETSGAVQIVLE